MAKRHAYEQLPDLILSDEEAERFEAMVEQAERDLASKADEVRVNFRWEKRHLDTIKRAADLMGVPYQSYLKQVVMQRALVDLATGAGTTGDGLGDHEHAHPSGLMQSN